MQNQNVTFPTSTLQRCSNERRCRVQREWLSVCVELRLSPSRWCWKFEISHERPVNRCFNSGNGVLHTCFGQQKEIRLQELSSLSVGSCEITQPELSAVSHSRKHACPYSTHSDPTVLFCVPCLWFLMTLPALFRSFFNRSCWKAKNINCAFKWAEWRSHLSKPTGVLTCFSNGSPVYVAEAQ